jgi:hypothetical protein
MSTQIFLNNSTTGLVGLFTQTVDSAIVGGASPSGSLLGAGIGSIGIPANGFAKGDSFKLNMGGHVNALNGKKLRVIVSSSTGAVFADTNDITMPSCTNQHWNLEIVFTIRKLGVSGTAEIASSGVFLYTKNASSAFEGDNFSLVNSTTFDTTVVNNLKVEAIWDTTDVGNSIYSETAVLTKIF